MDPNVPENKPINLATVEFIDVPHDKVGLMIENSNNILNEIQTRLQVQLSISSQPDYSSFPRMNTVSISGNGMGPAQARVEIERLINSNPSGMEAPPQYLTKSSLEESKGYTTLKTDLLEKDCPPTHTQTALLEKDCPPAHTQTSSSYELQEPHISHRPVPQSREGALQPPVGLERPSTFSQIDQILLPLQQAYAQRQAKQQKFTPQQGPSDQNRQDTNMQQPPFVHTQNLQQQNHSDAFAQQQGGRVPPQFTPQQRAFDQNQQETNEKQPSFFHTQNLQLQNHSDAFTQRQAGSVPPQFTPKQELFDPNQQNRTLTQAPFVPPQNQPPQSHFSSFQQQQAGFAPQQFTPNQGPSVNQNQQDATEKQTLCPHPQNLQQQNQVCAFEQQQVGLVPPQLDSQHRPFDQNQQHQYPQMQHKYPQGFSPPHHQLEHCSLIQQQSKQPQDCLPLHQQQHQCFNLHQQQNLPASQQDQTPQKQQDSYARASPAQQRGVVLYQQHQEEDGEVLSEEKPGGFPIKQHCPNPPFQQMPQPPSCTNQSEQSHFKPDQYTISFSHQQQQPFKPEQYNNCPNQLDQPPFNPEQQPRQSQQVHTNQVHQQQQKPPFQQFQLTPSFPQQPQAQGTPSFPQQPLQQQQHQHVPYSQNKLIEQQQQTFQFSGLQAQTYPPTEHVQLGTTLQAQHYQHTRSPFHSQGSFPPQQQENRQAAPQVSFQTSGCVQIPGKQTSLEQQGQYEVLPQPLQGQQLSPPQSQPGTGGPKMSQNMAPPQQLQGNNEPMISAQKDKEVCFVDLGQVKNEDSVFAPKKALNFETPLNSNDFFSSPDSTPLGQRRMELYDEQENLKKYKQSPMPEFQDLPNPYVYRPGDAQIVITAPTAGYSSYVGGALTITWSSWGLLGDAIVELYKGDNPVPATISLDANNENLTQGCGNATLNLNRMMSTGNDYRIKISDHKNVNTFSYSGYFSIEAAEPGLDDLGLNISCLLEGPELSHVFSMEEDKLCNCCAAQLLQNPEPSDPQMEEQQNLQPSADDAFHHSWEINAEDLKLFEVIGKGAFGQVHKGNWLGTTVAVKVLLVQGQLDENIARLFKAEVAILSALHHPNICLFMGACLNPPTRAIVTEFVSHGNLCDALRNFHPLRQEREAYLTPFHAWPWSIIEKIVHGTSCGMAYLHSKVPPILHRDLKSPNILLDENYKVKLADFGLARLKESTKMMTSNCGSPQWMAPEVMDGSKYDEKADVYSFGIVCWELLSRLCPYEGMNQTQVQVAVLLKHQRPVIPDWCPAHFQSMIEVSWKQAPNERPSFKQILEQMPWTFNS